MGNGRGVRFAGEPDDFGVTSDVILLPSFTPCYKSRMLEILPLLRGWTQKVYLLGCVCEKRARVVGRMYKEGLKPLHAVLAIIILFIAL
jgi:hypothetical protein